MHLQQGSRLNHVVQILHRVHPELKDLYWNTHLQKERVKGRRKDI